MVLIASRGIGNAGRMEIHDNGTQVQMRFRSSDSQTYSGAIPYRLYINGVWTNWGSVSYGPGSPWRDVYYAAVGAPSRNVAFQIGDTGTWGLGSGGELWGAINRATVPGAPLAVGVDQATATSLRFRFSGTTTGGAQILEWQAQVSTSSNFASPTTIGSSGTSTFTLLQPNQTYYFRARGRNSVGWGPWSAVNANAIGSTLPTPAPGLSVAPAPSGSSALITMNPPNGISSVTSYRVETRTIGGAATVHNTTANTLTLQRSPGTSYEYRSSAFVQSYQTPWTDWILVTQPQTNTNPGDYFDGSTAARDDLTFAWLGTANSSISVANGVSVAGWSTLGAGSVLQRVSGGLFGTHMARMLRISDAQSAGVGLGMSEASGSASVAEGGDYVASIYVRPSRAQRLTIALVWLNAANVSIGANIAGGALVTDTLGWTRLSVDGIAPPNTAKAVVRMLDIAGEGHSPWLSGEYLDADGAMITLGALYDYFDGSTRDTAEYKYEWLGAVNASASSRTTNTVALFDPLADPDCPPIPSAPLPPVIDSSCIDEVASWRRYWAIIPESEVYDWLSVVPTVTVTTGTAAARQVRIRFFANPDALDPSEAGELIAESEQIISYIPPAAEMVLDGVSQRAWATVGASENLPANHLLYGLGGGPATWPTLDCGSAYLISFDVPLDAPVGDVSVGVALTQRML